jgi:hypothetical protein
MKEFLTAEHLPIGSWWEMADGHGKYGYTVIAVNLITKDATVLSTMGETIKIDVFKLQYRYKQVIPNE